MQRYAILLFPEINICQVTQYTLTHHFIRRLAGFVVCRDTVNQQKHRRQRQQGYHRDFMRNESHYLVLHELAEKEKIYKDRVNINRADGDNQDLGRRYFLLQNLWNFPASKHLCVAFETFSVFSHTSVETLANRCFSSLKKLTCDIHKLPRSCFQVLHSSPILVFIWQCCEN